MIRSIRRALPLLVAASTFWRCAAQGESEQPGTCSLSCDTSRVAAVDFAGQGISPNGSVGSNFFCAADFSGQSVQPSQGPVTFRFQIFQLVTALDPASTSGGNPTGAGGDGNTTGGTTGFSLQDPGPDEEEGGAGNLLPLPKGGIAFEPVIQAGAVAAEKTNTEHLNGDGTISPFKYAGVVTPKSEWCTDTCGVATFEVWPLCFDGSDNTMRATIVSGAMTPPEPLAVSVHSDPR